MINHHYHINNKFNVIIFRLTLLYAAEKIESVGVDISHLTNLTNLNIRSNLIKDVQDLNGK